MGHQTLVEWEYLTIPEAERGRLHDLGREGWELVTASGSSCEPTLYLKRPRPDFRERVTLEQRRAYYRARGLAEPSVPGETGV